MELYSCPRMILVCLGRDEKQKGTSVSSDWMNREGKRWEKIALTTAEIESYYRLSDSYDLETIMFDPSVHGKLTGSRNDDEEEEEEDDDDDEEEEEEEEKYVLCVRV